MIAKIAHELIELTGRFDMQLSTQFIALYQVIKINYSSIFKSKCPTDTVNGAI